MDNNDQHETGALFQFVMFEVAGEIYGADLDTVQEVIRVTEISRVPNAPDFLEGMINLRGFFIPVIDLRKRFGFGAVERKRSARIMIIETEGQALGIMVDGVLEVGSAGEDRIEPPSPLIRGAIKSDYITGFTDVNGELVKILDLEKVFSSGEIESVKDLAGPEGDLPGE